MANIPAWWVTMPTLIEPVSKLFAEVMASSPIPDAVLAKRFKVTPMTVWRWGSEKTTPLPETMAEAVEMVRADLEERLERADVASKVLKHVVAAERADASRRGRSRRDNVEALERLLEGLGD